MHWVFIILGLLAVGIGITFFTDYFRLGKTVFLIARTSPYEQVGTGEQRLLVLGDSTGYGTGVRNKKNSIAGRIGGDFPAVTITNDSVNGRRLDELASEITTLDTSYDVILLQMGANDILGRRPVAEAMADLERLYAVLEPHTAQIIIMPAGNVGGASAYVGTPIGEQYEQLSRDYYAAITEFAAVQPKVTFVNLFEEPEVDPFVLRPSEFLAFDGLHPNDAGYGYWYAVLQPELQKHLSI